MYHDLPEHCLRVGIKALQAYCVDHPEEDEYAHALQRRLLKQVEAHRAQRTRYCQSPIGHYNSEFRELPGEVRDYQYAPSSMYSTFQSS